MDALEQPVDAAPRATAAITTATDPRMMKRQVSESSKRSVMNQKMTTPMIGPVWLPTPPMTTMKTTNAVHDSTLKASWLVTVELLRWISAPVAPVQSAAITHMSSLVWRTLTPRHAGAQLGSRAPPAWPDRGGSAG